MNRKKAKKKAQSRDCSCVLGKDRDNNYNSVLDKVFDDHEKKVKKLSIHLVSKSFIKKQIDEAYNKGYSDGLKDGLM